MLNFNHRKTKYILVAGLIALPLRMNTAAGASNRARSGAPLVFCSADTEINFNPFRSFPSRGFTYFTFTRPIFGEKGIISRHYFSPDGVTFEGEIAEDAEFAFSKRKVTSRDVAYSIVGQLAIRLPELQIFPKGTSSRYFKEQWWKLNVPGVDIISEKAFRITWSFPAGSKNISGRLTEILSREMPSLKGAFWVTDVSGSHNDFVSSFPAKKVGVDIVFDLAGEKVSIRSVNEGCVDPSFVEFDPKRIGAKPEDYTASTDSASNPFVAILNSNRLQKSERILVATLLRRAAYDVAKMSREITVPKSHFTYDETGYSDNISWDKYESEDQSIQKKVSIKKLTVLVLKGSDKSDLHSKYYAEFQNQMKKVDVHVNYDFQSVPVNFEKQDVGLFVFASARKRQKWLEGATTVLGLERPLEKFRETLSAMQIIQRNASATIPTSADDLQRFDRSALDEYSIVPVFRSFRTVYSKRGQNVEFKFRNYSYPELYVKAQTR